jgi:acid phosphatase (class A)
MQEIIKELKYGNIRRDDYFDLQRQTYIDGLFSALTQYTFPPNNSNTTQDELNELVSATQELSEAPEVLQEFYNYDQNLTLIIKKFLVAHKVPKDDAISLVDAVIYDIQPLLLKLKYYFQRPRPYQLSYYYKLKLIAFNSVSDQTPSYPSGHALQSKVLAYVIGDKYPKLYNKIHELADKIGNSRLYMGLHYQSDIDYANIVAEKIYENKELKLKFQI